MGGPAGLFKNISHHPLCWNFLNISEKLADNETLSLKFISFHKKGEGISENIANSSQIFVNEIHEKYPKLKNLPIANT